MWLFATFGMNLAGQELLSVCEIQQAPERYAGREVKIRGLWYTGFEADHLYDPACNQSIEREGQTWVSSVWLNLDRGASLHVNGVEMDQSAHEDALMAKREANAGGADLWVTFVGRLDYCRPQYLKMRPGDRMLWVGCGHMGLYVTQLTPRTVEDAKVGPKVRSARSADPQQALWDDLKKMLSGPNVDQYWKWMEGTPFPLPGGVLRARVVSVSGRLVKIAIPTSFTPELTLELTEGLKKLPKAGMLVAFSGRLTKFTQGPFMVTVEVGPKDHFSIDRR